MQVNRKQNETAAQEVHQLQEQEESLRVLTNRLTERLEGESPGVQIEFDVDMICTLMRYYARRSIKQLAVFKRLADIDRRTGQHVFIGKGLAKICQEDNRR